MSIPTLSVPFFMVLSANATWLTPPSSAEQMVAVAMNLFVIFFICFPSMVLYFNLHLLLVRHIEYALLLSLTASYLKYQAYFTFGKTHNISYK